MKHKRLKHILGVMSVATCLVAASGGNAHAIRIDFDEAELPGYGVDITDQLQAEYGLTLSASNKNNRNSSKDLWLYNSSCDPSGGCVGGDPDLATGTGSYNHNGWKIRYNTPDQGNVLIVQENNHTPDDDAGGGWINFDFDQAIDFRNIALLDLDDGEDPKFEFTFANGATHEWTFSDNDDEVSFVRDNENKNWSSKETKDGETTRKNENNSLREYDFSGLSDDEHDFTQVTGFGVRLPSSGAVAYLEYFREVEEPNVKVPEPASLLGLAAVGMFGYRLKRKR
ncbi:MAG: PEP-CTERM sorting domain-containing protein [Cyanobacteria bacterium P01_A01_bin.123]